MVWFIAYMDDYKDAKKTYLIFPKRYPPESLRERTFTSKSDVWMFGMTVWEICMFGERPWKNLSSQQVFSLELYFQLFE